MLLFTSLLLVFVVLPVIKDLLSNLTVYLFGDYANRNTSPVVLK